MPSHLRPANDHPENKSSQKGGLTIGEFLAEGKKYLENFRANSDAYSEQRAMEQIHHGDGEYDLETMPEVVQQQEKDWPKSRSAQKTASTYETKEYSSPTQDDRKVTLDRYAEEIFDTKPTDTCGFGGFIKTKSEIQVETAKEVKKKWEKMESNFLAFDTKEEDAPTQSQPNFSDFSAFSSTKEPHRRPRIFDDDNEVKSKQPVFEEWWDDPKKKQAYLQKENTLSGYPSTKVNDLYAVKPNNMGRNLKAGTSFGTNPNSTDWLSSNPFEVKVGNNLMDY